MSNHIVDRPARRITLFLVSLLVRTFGMALMIESALGASPSSVVPYAAHIVWPSVYLAVFATIVSIIEVIIQKILYGKRMSNLQFLAQIIISFLFGIALDGFVSLLDFISLNDYPVKLAMMLLGCAVMAFGVYLELTASFTMLTGDGMNRAISFVTGYKYGNVKMATDFALVLIALVILATAGEISDGIREGTIVAALLVGPIVNLYNRYLGGLKEFLMPDNGIKDDKSDGLMF